MPDNYRKDKTSKNHAHWVEVLNLPVTRTQRMAMAYLESKGMRFMVDFGTDNAIEVATYFDDKPGSEGR